MCLPITDCSGIVGEGGRKAFHSVTFLSFLPSYHPFFPYVLLLCKLQHWSPFFFSTLIVFTPPLSPSVPSSSFSVGTNPTICRRRFSLSLSLSLSSLAGTWTKKEVYKFAQRNCHEKYGILSTSKATLVAAWETPSRMGNEVPFRAAAMPPLHRRSERGRTGPVVGRVEGSKSCWLPSLPLPSLPPPRPSSPPPPPPPHCSLGSRRVVQRRQRTSVWIQEFVVMTTTCLYTCMNTHPESVWPMTEETIGTLVTRLSASIFRPLSPFFRHPFLLKGTPFLAQQCRETRSFF